MGHSCVAADSGLLNELIDARFHSDDLLFDSHIDPHTNPHLIRTKSRQVDFDCWSLFSLGVPADQRGTCKNYAPKKAWSETL